MERLPMCRICLVENVRMYIVNDKDLQELYETLTDIPFLTEDRRPMLACFLCFSKLKQCYQLKRKCLEAEELFAQMLNELNPSESQVQLKYSSGLIVTPVENISISDVSHVERIAIKEELPGVCERLDDVSETKEEHMTYELELESLNNSYSVAEDVPARQFESHDDVVFMGIEMDVGEEQEVLRKKRRDTTQAAILKKRNLHIRGIRPEDGITEHEKKKEEFDTEVVQNTQNDSSKLIPKIQDFLTNRTAIDKRNVKKQLLVHAVEKPFKCHYCQRCFRRKDHLISHIRTHTREKPYECKVCHVCFSQKVHLTSHIRTHTGKKPFKCEQCQHSFSRKDYLKRHVRGHTGEKPYKCDVCQRTFRHKSILIRHRLVHTAEKPYKCEYCHLFFRQKAHLTGHIRTHTGEKPYNCEICYRTFNLKSDVGKHYKRVHTREKPYTCDICQQFFNYKGNLMRHMRIHSEPNGLEHIPEVAVGT